MIASWFLVMAIVFFLTASAFFSGMEAAVFSLSRFRLKSLLFENRPGAQNLKRLKSDPHLTLGGILFGNLLVNTAVSSLATITINIIIANWSISPSLIFLFNSLIMTSLLLIIGEITPKTIMIADPERYALKFGQLLSVLLIPFRPLVYIINKVILSFLPVHKSSFVTDKEIKYMLAEARQLGIVDATEEQFAYQIMRFGRMTVREIMTPRNKVAGVSSDEALPKIMAVIRRTRHARICVFDSTREVIGVIYAKDIFSAASQNQEQKALDCMREPYFIPETKRIDSLLDEFRKKGVHFAVVVDEFGVFSGIITLEDVLESIFGEITDEYEARADYIMLSKEHNGYTFAGDTGINDLRQVFGDQFPGQDGDRLAGIIIRQLGRFPRRNETFTIGSFTITVRETRGREIRRVVITQT